MIEEPKHWSEARLILNLGANSEVAIEHMMSEKRISREEAITALRYAKSRGAGKKFEKIHRHFGLDQF